MVVVYQSLLETNGSTAETSYHLTGSIDLDGYPGFAAGRVGLGRRPNARAHDRRPADRRQVLAAVTRTEAGRARSKRVDLHVEAIPRRVQMELETARLVSNNIAHAGDTVVVEATVRPWQQPARNVRIPVTLPARLGAGNLRLLVSDAGTLDRTLDQPRFSSRPADMETVLAQARRQHPADRIYVSLLVPETQAGMDGQTLGSLPLSVANALEPLRAAQDVNLNGESAESLARRRPEVC